MKPKRPDRQSQRGQKRGKQKETLVFDPSERIDFVKGFQKRKQERRERAKQEVAVQEREIRKLLRQKRREALKRAQLGAGAGHGNESDDNDGREMESDGVDGAVGGGVEVQEPPSPPSPQRLDSGDIEQTATTE